MSETYDIYMVLIGIAFLMAAWLPRLLHGKPISVPVIYIGFGMVVFALPLGLQIPSPFRHPEIVERATELVVIVALMGVGLKLDRRVGWRSWSSTWRLLGITMPLCIAAFALIGWWTLGLSPVAAILLGAVLAPTDPVLAADVQSAPPLEGRSGEVRFALTSESGLNDGLAFPFTNLALALAAAGASGWTWFGNWLWHDLIYKVGVGLFAGIMIGHLLAWFVFKVRMPSPLAQSGEGIAAIAITLISYAGTELLGGYGFLAVFVSALVVRRHEEKHEYHRELHAVAYDIERLLMVIVLVYFGGALATGLLASLTWKSALVGLIFVLVVRPLTGLLAMAGTPLRFRGRAAIAFFGIRGVGSFYYLSYALNRLNLPEADVIWSTVAFVVLISILVHGITATPVMWRVEPEPDHG